MGEQGTEAMHAHFNKLYSAYDSMVNKVQRLKCITDQNQKKQAQKENIKNKACTQVYTHGTYVIYAFTSDSI